MSTNASTPDQYAGAITPTLTPEEIAALPHDNGASRLLASGWSLAFVATVFLVLRIYCRMLKRQRLWWDDAILIASWVCMIIEVSLLSHVTTLGYGLHIWDFDLTKMQDLMLPMNVAGTFSVTGAVWSKTSFGITLLHVTDGWLRRITWFCIISMNIAMFLSALFPWVSCTPVQKTWDLSVEGTCWDPTVTVYYNIFSAAYSALMDFALAALPWKFLWGLQMKRGEKVGVGVAMSMGVFAGATAIVKTTKLPLMLSNDFADGITIWIWGNAEVCSSIIAASIPMLRVLVRDAKSSNRSPSAYYDKEAGISAGGTHSRFVTITSRGAPAAAAAGSDLELHKLGDDRSDRSILGDNKGQSKNGIIQVTDFTVKYDEDSTEGDRGRGADGVAK